MQQIFSIAKSRSYSCPSNFGIKKIYCNQLLRAVHTRHKHQDQGPEPVYDKVVSGFQMFHYRQPFKFDCGSILPEIKIAYETWGTLNQARNNAILLHTGLSASSHAHSHSQNTHQGWWEDFIGSSLAIDTNKFFVICTNVIGGCYGTTGPSSINPLTGKRYATSFPILTVFDMVRAQFLLLDYLGIEKLHASIGSSLGGMQSLAAAALYPNRVSRLITISACAASHPYSIAMRYTQRRVLMSDPNWNGGNYYDGPFPHVGMKLAREMATITYRSGPEWESRFGRKRIDDSIPPNLFGPDYAIEEYLDRQGERFCLQYDPNSFIYISKAMDCFDMSIPVPVKKKDNGYTNEDKETKEEEEDEENVKMCLSSGMSRIKCPTLVLGVDSDILFPCWQQKQIASLLKINNKWVTHYILDAMYGHDTFLIDVHNVGSAIKGHLENETFFK